MVVSKTVTGIQPNKSKQETLETERVRTELVELKARRLAAQLQVIKLEKELAELK